MKESDFKRGDLVSFDLTDPKLGGEYIALVEYTEDGFVYVNAGLYSEEAEMYVKLEPEAVRKVSDTEMFKKRLEGKGIGMEGYIKWANGS